MEDIVCYWWVLHLMGQAHWKLTFGKLEIVGEQVGESKDTPDYIEIHPISQRDFADFAEKAFILFDSTRFIA